MSAEFCDTNVIAYAYDLSDATKRRHAGLLLDRLWTEGQGVLSVQVLQELFVTLTKRHGMRMPTSDVWTVVETYAQWNVIVPEPIDVLAAIDVADRWQVSFWDSLVLTTARKAGASVLWTEDLNHGQVYDGVTVRNPFV